MDVDGSTIQIYRKDDKEVVVYDDYDVGAVFIKSDVDLSEILNPETDSPWQKVEDTFFYGTWEEIEALRCPDCGHELEISVTEVYESFSIKCHGCGILIRNYKWHSTPRFLFDKTYIPKNVMGLEE